jgi:hypothetical protein
MLASLQLAMTGSCTRTVFGWVLKLVADQGLVADDPA